MKTCIGCGVLLQTSNSNEIGYIVVNLENKLYCQRCFKITNYNELLTISNLSENNDLIFKKINYSQLIFYIVDITNFFSSLIFDIHQKLICENTYLIINKIDLLDRSINLNKVQVWVEKQLLRINLSVNKIILVSAINDYNLEQIANIILKSKKNAYFIGNVNSGKSMLLNNLQNKFNLKNKLTTSYYPATTLDLVPMKINPQQIIYDSPGYINETQIFYYVSNQDLKLFKSKKSIKCRTYQLQSEQTITVGSLIQFNFIEGSNSAFHFYFPNSIKFHRTKYQNANNIWQQQLLSPKLLNSNCNFEKISFDNLQQEIGLEISGLGWISFKTNGQVITIRKPEAVKITIINPLV